MDEWLLKFAALANKEAVLKLPGSGAAGGLGFALSDFCRAHLESGISLVLDILLE